MKKITLLIVFGLFIFLGSMQMALAADSYACQCANGTQSKETSCENCTSRCKNANSTNASCIKVASTSGSGSTVGKTTNLPNPLGKGVTIETLAARIIEYVLGFIGTISLLLFIYGGFIWMTSAGSAEKVKKGRDVVIWAVVGMAVIFMSYIMVKFVIQALQGSLK